MATWPDSSTDEPDDQDLGAFLPPGYRGEPRSPTSSVETRPVDQIAVRKLGGYNYLTPGQWGALSRDDRMKLLKKKAVSFLYQGEAVPLHSALLYLQSINGRRSHAQRLADSGDLAFPPPQHPRTREA